MITINGSKAGSLREVLVLRTDIFIFNHQPNRHKVLVQPKFLAFQSSASCRLDLLLPVTISYFFSVDCGSWVCGENWDVAVGSRCQPAAAHDAAQRRSRTPPKNRQEVCVRLCLRLKQISCSKRSIFCQITAAGWQTGRTQGWQTGERNRSFSWGGNFGLR